jgi:hypothetical protein
MITVVSRGSDKPPSQAHAVCLGHNLALVRGHPVIEQSQDPRDSSNAADRAVEDCSWTAGIIHKPAWHTRGKAHASVWPWCGYHRNSRLESQDPRANTPRPSSGCTTDNGDSARSSAPARTVLVARMPRPRPPRSAISSKHGNGCTTPTQAQNTTTDAASACMSG